MSFVFNLGMGCVHGVGMRLQLPSCTIYFHRSHSISFTRAQAIPKYKIGESTRLLVRLDDACQPCPPAVRLSLAQVLFLVRNPFEALVAERKRVVSMIIKDEEYRSRRQLPGGRPDRALAHPHRPQYLSRDHGHHETARRRAARRAVRSRLFKCVHSC